jgi:beta-lactamase class A
MSRVSRIPNSKFLILAAAVLAAQPSPTTSELKAKFERRLQEIAARVDGVVGYEMLDLTSGEKISRLERETFPAASRSRSRLQRSNLE